MQATNAFLDLRESREDFQGQEQKCLILHIMPPRCYLAGALHTWAVLSRSNVITAGFVMVLFQISTTVGRSIFESQNMS